MHHQWRKRFLQQLRERVSDRVLAQQRHRRHQQRLQLRRWTGMPGCGRVRVGDRRRKASSRVVAPMRAVIVSLHPLTPCPTTWPPFRSQLVLHLLPPTVAEPTEWHHRPRRLLHSAAGAASAAPTASAPAHLHPASRDARFHRPATAHAAGFPAPAALAASPTAAVDHPRRAHVVAEPLQHEHAQRPQALMNTAAPRSCMLLRCWEGGRLSARWPLESAQLRCSSTTAPIPGADRAPLPITV